ncbi:uncharacterized protein LOC124710364 [Schistocerca piceifrons]|uniref:uncharacterized protein LOC124710364 n=1 Tax=Schistocerca piceifrons TaxID=274613 RepID=UPI001F5ED2F9|nr:uncharacterized protein LOC124710364 [Schistocerca piceifrons]XP_049780776.1 uncharacterized protein LOC126182047 [Schistocerca cancellata]XP_049863334.1 uncharacterized protein LOC126356510 [Schistocerca gregaria]XP_049959547.1 uncharacterized protein LOC126477080 [Schistocerca serialis cubense]
MDGMFSNPKLRSFVNRNLVAIVMIPSLIGIHWGWLRLQSVEEFVPKEERKDLPIIRMYHKLKDEAVQRWFAEETRDKPTQE